MMNTPSAEPTPEQSRSTEPTHHHDAASHREGLIAAGLILTAIFLLILFLVIRFAFTHDPDTSILSALHATAHHTSSISQSPSPTELALYDSHGIIAS